MEKTILFTGAALPKIHQDLLIKSGYKLKLERSDLSESELIEALKGVSAFILGGVEKANRRVLESSPDLKLVAFFGVGYETYIDAQAASDLGIAVTNTPGANAKSVAEFTLSLMLDAVKHTTYLIEATKRGEWKEIKSWNLSGKTLGVVGMGTIGMEVAKIARNGFGMNILYTGRSRKKDVETALSARFVALPELLRSCDILSLHANINQDTIGMIGKKELALMKPESVLVNCSRAELVDADALKDALSEGKLACAAFDGYYIEPVPNAKEDPHGLIALSNKSFIVSPHTAYFTEDATLAMADMACKNVLEILSGQRPTNVVNDDYLKNARA